MYVDPTKLKSATVALSARLAASEPGSFLSEQIRYLMPILEEIQEDLIYQGESIIKWKRREDANTE